MGLAWPTTTPPKLIDVGETPVGFTPAPLNGTVSGLLGALVRTVSELLATAPATVGVSVI
jgi:hypothetical protein